MSKKRYIVQGAQLECTGCPGKTQPFMMGKTRNVMIGNRSMPNRDNTEKDVDISPFEGECQAEFDSKDAGKPKMCAQYMDLNDQWDDLTLGIGGSSPIMNIGSAPALTMNAILRCKKGGIIRPVTDGQENEELEGMGIDPDVPMLSSDLQYIYYKGKKYKIHVPPQDGGAYFTLSYEEIYSLFYDEKSFNIAKGLLEFELEGPADIKTHAGYFLISDQSSFSGYKEAQMAGGAHLAHSLIGFVGSGLESSEINLSFQESASGDTRVIIYVGSYDMRVKYNEYATGIPQSAFVNNYGNPFGQAVISTNCKNMYESETGNKPSALSTFDLVITLDEGHANSPNYGYLSFDESENLITTPIIYGKDSVVIKDRGWIDPYPDLDLSSGLNQPITATPTEKALFQQVLSGNGESK